MSRRRVVVTGLGIVSPVGANVTRAGDHALKGKSGSRPIKGYDASTCGTRFAGEASDDVKAEEWMGPEEIRKTDPFIPYGVAAAGQALEGSEVEVTVADRERMGSLVG